MRQGTRYQRPRAEPRPGETIHTSTCGHNCGGRCVVNAHVVDGRITRISSDPARWNPQLPPLSSLAPARLSVVKLGNDQAAAKLIQQSGLA